MALSFHPFAWKMLVCKHWLTNHRVAVKLVKVQCRSETEHIYLPKKGVAWTWNHHIKWHNCKFTTNFSNQLPATSYSHLQSAMLSIVRAKVDQKGLERRHSANEQLNLAVRLVHIDMSSHAAARRCFWWWPGDTSVIRKITSHGSFTPWTHPVSPLWCIHGAHVKLRLL